MTESDPAIQLIANLVVERSDGAVLLARYDSAGELDDDDADVRWWLPAHELEPYQHPDEAAHRALDEIGGLTIESIDLARIQSFRGRRGWHLSFDYHVRADGEPGGDAVPADWHDATNLPPTMHGSWERDTIEAVRQSGD